MNIKFDIPEWLKIPLKILVPSLFLFSGIMLFAPNSFLKKIYIYDWKDKNGFVFGLIFIITICLIVVYITAEIIKLIKKRFNAKNSWKKIIKMLLRFDLPSLKSVQNFYYEPTHNLTIDVSHPIIRGLISQKILFCPNQAVTLGYGNSMMGKCFLQPYITEALNKYREYASKEYRKCLRKNKIKKAESINSEYAKILGDKLNG